MASARHYDSVRTTVNAGSLLDRRSIPAGTEGVVLEARPDGTCLVELAFTAQSTEQDGDYMQAVLTEGQYEIISC
jgi:hypothetical protein